VQWVDLAGYGASLLALMTFYMKDMIKLRSSALCGNPYRQTTPVTWTCYPRALICVIAALVITIGILAVITTAPAGPSELSFFEPVG
jgi:hypothetical protein